MRSWREIREHRRALIQELWPDKTLYATVVLFLAATVSLAYGALLLMVPVRYHWTVPDVLQPSAVWCIIFAALTAAGTLSTLATQKPAGVWFATATAFLAVGPLGFSSFLAIVAAFLVRAAHKEGEHSKPETLALTVLDWPDKSLAGGLILGMAGCASVVWGIALLRGDLVVGTSSDHVLGVYAVGAGIGTIAAGIAVWNQLAQWAGLLTSVATILTISFYLVGPILGIVAFILVRLAHREREFEAPAGVPLES